jgi:U4/U6.U5 tri-snRNP-associated protein 3
LMGFSRFSSTKGKKHVDYGGVETHKTRKYRQYMNRPGGFNRPLDPSVLVP